jgi:hypothetical protein
MNCKKLIICEMCVLFAFTTFVWNMFMGCSWHVHGSTHSFYVTCLLLLSHFKQNWNVSTDLSKAPEYLISWKSVRMFWSCLNRDRHSKAGRCSFATSCCQCTEDRNGFQCHFPMLDDFASVWASFLMKLFELFHYSSNLVSDLSPRCVSFIYFEVR